MEGYDVLGAATGFIDGPEATVAVFRAGKDAGSATYATVVAVLHSDSSEANQPHQRQPMP